MFSCRGGARDDPTVCFLQSEGPSEVGPGAKRKPYEIGDLWGIEAEDARAGCECVDAHGARQTDVFSTFGTVPRILDTFSGRSVYKPVSSGEARPGITKVGESVGRGRLVSPSPPSTYCNLMFLMTFNLYERYSYHFLYYACGD